MPPLNCNQSSRHHILHPTHHPYFIITQPQTPCQSHTHAHTPMTLLHPHKHHHPLTLTQSLFPPHLQSPLCNYSPTLVQSPPSAHLIAYQHSYDHHHQPPNLYNCHHIITPTYPCSCISHYTITITSPLIHHYHTYAHTHTHTHTHTLTCTHTHAHTHTYTTLLLTLTLTPTFTLALTLPLTPTLTPTPAPPSPSP
jgi:hypothetical protein